MRILVTGATGFIGHHVVQWLVDFLYGEGQNPKSLQQQLDAAIDRGDAEFPMSGVSSCGLMILRSVFPGRL